MIPDQAVRESIRTETGRSVVVEASAGTGKTTLLTDRVAAMVSGGVPLEEIAVVTFTDAAAGELRQRIRDKLPGDTGKGMDQAWIHTIHGFASRILREYFYLTGTAAEFATETSHFSHWEAEILWDLFLSSRNSEDLRASASGLRYPGSSGLLDTAMVLEKQRWINTPEVLGSSKTRRDLLTAKWTGRLQELAGKCSDPGDKLCSRILAALENLSNGVPEAAGIHRGAGGAKNWGGPGALKEVKELLLEYGNERETILALSLMIPVEPAMEKLVFPFIHHLRNRWDSDPSRLSFNDLLFMAERAVTDSSELRDLLAAKFKYIFIDEFQDTSLLQVNLFSSILQETGLKHKLTVVGDPKQSIYGWRSADMETYKATIGELEGSGALSKTIMVNFRSCRSIIRFVNSFGEALFRQATPDERPFSATYSPIEPSPGAPEGQGVFVHRLPGINGAKAERYARLQAVTIANLIEKPESTAVLFRAKTRMDEFLQELDARSIPWRVEAGMDFHARDEVRDTALLLRYMLFPDDQRVQVETLRSMFFGIDDRTISLWKTTGEMPGEIAEALKLMEQLRGKARTLPGEIFLRHLFENTCILESVRRSGYQTTRRMGNLGFILERAGTSSDLYRLLETLEGRSPVSADEPSTGRAGGAVTVTTIHSAKGLAWEHVILADPGPSFTGPGRILSDPGGRRLAVKLGEAASAEYETLKHRENARMLAEYRRLLYVAVTRPKNRLDMIIQPSSSEKPTPCGVIDSALSASENFETLNIEDSAPELVNTHFSGVCPAGIGDSFHDLFQEDFPDENTERSRAMRLGTEVHSVLEFIDMDSPLEWLEKNRDSLQEQLEFPEGTLNLVKSFFRCFDLKGAVVKGREYPVVSMGEFYYIDLLLERNGCLEAVDYKTDTGDPRERAGVYRKHQELYRELLQKATGKRVKTFLVFLHHEEVVEI